MHRLNAVILLISLTACQEKSDSPPTAIDAAAYEGRLLTPAGEPLALAAVVLLRSGSFELAARTTSDAKGNFRVELDPGPYWLVARDAARTYLDTSFTLFERVPTLSPVGRPPAAAAKIVAEDDILGDVNGSGEVDYWDLMLMIHHLVNWPALSSAYDFTMGDINQDGEIDWTDLALLGDFLYGYPKPPNTYKIGESMSTDSTNERRMQANLSPDPSGTTFTADGETWHQFRLSVITALGHQGRYSDRVNVKIDAPSILKVYLWASTVYGCSDDLDEYETYNLQSVSFLACREGSANIILEDEDGNELNRYAVEIEARPAASERDAATSFNIKLVFVPQSSYTEHQKDLLRQAAARWERVITSDIPNVSYYTYFPFDTRNYTGTWDTWWRDNMRSYFGDIRVNDVVDDVRIFVGGPVPDDDVWGRGGAIQTRSSGHHPILSTIKLSRNLMNENDSTVYRVILHEIGHALGFSSWMFKRFELLHNPSVNHPAHLSAPDSYFSGIKAVTAFNWAGGNRYRGNKVPIENDPDHARDSHWRESVMDGELMTSVWDVAAPMSAITIQAMADMGYTVDVGEAESYSVPRVSAKVTTVRERPFCQVIRPPEVVIDFP